MDLREYTRQKALAAGVRPELIINQFGVESAWNPNAVSPKNARGIAQFIPETGARYGLHTPEDFMNPYKSIDAGIAHMSDLLADNGGDERLALAAYNAGQGAVNKYKGVPPYKETQNYVKKILGGGSSERQAQAAVQTPPSTQSSPPQAPAMNPSFMPPPGREEPWGVIEPKMGPQSLLDRMGTNPWLQMGLGILADNNIGSGAQRGLLAASQMQKQQGDRRQQAIVNEQRRRDAENYRQQNQMNRYRMAGGGAETAAARSQREGKTYRMWDDKGNFHMVYRGPNGEFMDAVTQTPILPEVGRTLKTDSMLGGKGGASGASGGADGMTAEEKKRNKQQASIDELGSLYQLISEDGTNIGPAGKVKQLFGRGLGYFGSEWGGEMASEIAAIQGRASAATSGIAKEIVNEGDNRMSDADRRAAADIAKIDSWTSAPEALQGVKTVMCLKHRRMLIDQGIPPEQIYDPITKMPTELGTPPQFRMTGGQGAPQTPPQSAGMGAMPPQAGGGIDPRQARIDELEREKQSYLQQGMGPQGPQGPQGMNMGPMP